MAAIHHNTNHNSTNALVPLSLVDSPYGYAALLDADGNEQPITDSMIRLACEQVLDTLYAHLPSRSSPPHASSPQQNA